MLKRKSLKELIYISERMDTNRSGSFYDKSHVGGKGDYSHFGYTNEQLRMLLYAVGLVAAALSLFENDLLSADTIFDSLLATTFASISIYAFVFSFIQDTYYGIRLVDYTVTRGGSINPKFNIYISCSALILCMALIDGNPFTTHLLTLVLIVSICSFVDMVICFIDLFGNGKGFHDEIRTYVLNDIIAQLSLDTEHFERYMLDLFQEASISIHASDTIKLEDDLYVLRCLFGQFSTSYYDLTKSEYCLLRSLRKRTGQLITSLSRYNDYTHTLVLIRRVSSRPLANVLSYNESRSLNVRMNLGLFDFYDELCSLLFLLRAENINSQRLSDLIRDNLCVYGMTCEAMEKLSDITLYDSGPFNLQRLVSLIRLTCESIYFNTEMSDSEKCLCLERIFLRQSIRDRIRIDGQNTNDYDFDFKLFWARKMRSVFLPEHYLAMLTNAKRY